MIKMPEITDFVRFQKQLILVLVWLVGLPIFLYMYSSNSSETEVVFYGKPDITADLSNASNIHMQYYGVIPIQNESTREINSTTAVINYDTSSNLGKKISVTNNILQNVTEQNHNITDFNYSRQVLTNQKSTTHSLKTEKLLNVPISRHTHKSNAFSTENVENMTEAHQTTSRIANHSIITGNQSKNTASTIRQSASIGKKSQSMPSNLTLHSSLSVSNQSVTKAKEAQSKIKSNKTLIYFTTNHPSPTKKPETHSTGGRQFQLTVNCSRMWVSAHTGGRLGNQMCEYAHLLMLHLEHGVQVGLLSPMYSALHRIFPYLSIQLLPQKCLQGKHAPTLNWESIDSALRGKTLQNSSIFGGYPCNASRLWRHRVIWRKEFVFSTTIKNKAHNMMRNSLEIWKTRRKTNWETTQMEQNSSTPPLTIGVHVRRSDYITYIRRTTGAEILQRNYFIQAFEHFRRKYGEVLFLVTSDDRKWCQQNLEAYSSDVIVTPKASDTDDLAFLSLNSHLVMSLGTYGFWGASLANGTVTFPKKVGKNTEYFMTKNMRLINSTDVIPISF